MALYGSCRPADGIVFNRCDYPIENDAICQLTATIGMYLMLKSMMDIMKPAQYF